MIEEPIKQKSYIDITELSNFLRSDWMKRFNLDGDYIQLIEEVVFICVNDNFINDIQDIRKMIIKKYPKLNIPTSNPYQAELIIDFIYENLHEDYKESIEQIIKKYKLLPQLYWEDMFFVFDGKIKEEIRKEKTFSNNATNNMNLKLLDSIVVRNKPFAENDAFPFWANPYFTRKTNELEGITINLENDGLPSLQIGFPPYATIQEMQKLIKENYRQIQEYREKYLPLPIQRDHRKDNLPKMIDAYMLDVQGEKKAIIANYLDERYGGSISFEAINQLVSRIKTESNRFNQNKQET